MNTTSPLSIALVGYGSMGREIERLAADGLVQIVRVFDIDNPWVDECDFDVAIDFTSPDVVLHSIANACRLKKPIVVGTTGWLDSLDRVRDMVESANIGLIFASNFSPGVHIFFALIRRAAELATGLTDYDLMIHEWHHRRKLDSPSGTALTAASVILEEHTGKKRIEVNRADGPIARDVLHVTSTRGGDITGIHELVLDSSVDSIEIRHSAKNRSGFASGALLAARWIHQRKGIYNFADIAEDVFHSVSPSRPSQ